MKKDKLIELLRDDEYYYNGKGRELVSVSHIDLITKTPELYIKFLAGQYTSPTTTPMILGGALHTEVLEGRDALTDKYEVINIQGRGTKIFKEYNAKGKIKLTTPEYLNLNQWHEALKTKENDPDIFQMLNPVLWDVEVPNTIQILGVDWKGKADLVTDDCVYDLKTTSDIAKFKYSAYKYGYDSQAWLYSKMFGLEVKFIVVDKVTLQVGVFECSQTFLDSGRAKIEATSIFVRDYITPTLDGDDKVSGIVNREIL